MDGFSFRLHGHKHAFDAKTTAERDGWYLAVEKTMDEAKASKDGILSSDGYKESISHLGKFDASHRFRAQDPASSARPGPPSSHAPRQTGCASGCVHHRRQLHPEEEHRRFEAHRRSRS